jgi:hypothetical protein
MPRLENFDSYMPLVMPVPGTKSGGGHGARVMIVEAAPFAASPSAHGKLAGSTQLASGRFAMIDNGLAFSLVPW